MSTQNKKKSGLGRGLSALLENAETDVTSSEFRPLGGVSLIQISQIEANPFQPRTEFDQLALNELAESIKVHGVIQPVTVRKMGYDKFQLISGERRTRAAILAGLDKIPAYIRVANDQEALEMALVENIQRADLNAIEVAMSYKRLQEECNLKQEELGDRVGKDRSTVNNYLRLLRLPDEIQAGIKEGKLSMGHARALINMADMAEQLEAYHRILEDNLSVRSTEELVRGLKESGGKKKNTEESAARENPFVEYTHQLADHLKTRVEIKAKKGDRGQILISFKNRKELDELVKLLNG